MNNILIFSQDGNFTGYCRSIAIGQRQENFLIGDKIKELLDKRSIVLDDLIHTLGNSYRDSITRVYNNQEIPKKQLVDKLVKYFEVDDDYFTEKELKNVLITDGGIIVAKYPTNKDAEEKKMEIDNIILESARHNQPIIINLCAK